jgi:hypothetical protein
MYWKAFLITILVLSFLDFFGIGFNPSPELEVVVGSVALVGGMLGTGLAFISQKYVTNIKATANALRLGLWIPVFGMWAVPWVSPLGTLTVAAATCYYHLASRSLLFLEPLQAKSLVKAETILHALLITLLIQVLEPSGFEWFAIDDSYGPVKASSTLIFILVALYLVSTKMAYGFAIAAKVHSKIAEDFISNDGRLSVKTKLVSAAVIALIWQALSLLALDTWISSPWSVLKMAISDLLSGYPLWSDIAASVGEICLGLFICVAITFYLYEFLSTRITIQSPVWKFLYFTHITPIIFVPWLFHWGILRGFWLATACVALLSFSPVFRVLSGLANRSAKLQVIVASLEALPNAFVGMLFSETMNSFGGLGFALTPVTADSRGGAEKSMALLLIVFLLMALMSWLLRCMARTEQGQGHSEVAQGQLR